MMCGLQWKNIIDDAIDQWQRRTVPAFEPEEDISNIQCDTN